MSLTLPQAPNPQALSRQSRKQDGAFDSSAVLEIALAQFGSILTDDERKKLQSQKSGLNDAEAAFKFTLELDDLDPVKRGRTFASKLCSFLQIVQSFGQIIDTYVSSNPEVAALIWGSVKLTFMVLINFTSYFQKFTDLLRGFDHLIPQLTAYEKLFPNSERLKTSICDLHTAIIICCTQVIKLTRLQWKRKAWAALTLSFESQIRPLIDHIRDAASQAKEEVGLAKAECDRLFQNQQNRQQSNILGQSIISNLGVRNIIKDRKHQEKVHRWKSLLKRLSTYDFETAYKNARSKRHKGTAQWVFETQQYQDWQEAEVPVMLHVTGKIGSGKTVITASIIDRILRNKTKGQAVSLFFIRFDEADSQDSEVIVRSIVRQVLDQVSFNDVLLELLEKSSKLCFDLNSLVEVMFCCMKLLDEFFLILDGLEEASENAQRTTSDFIGRLAREDPDSRVKTVISARECVRDMVENSFVLVCHVLVGSDETDRDLILFSQEILREKQRGDWGVGDENLIDEIIHCISLGGEGMFLWAYLTIEDICTRRTDNDIRKALREVPRNLCDIFDRTLMRIERRGNAEMAQGVFKWTAAACSPLTLGQLSEVLTVKPNQPSSEESQRVNKIACVPLWCENLVSVEDGSETVHFSHHSIKAYILGSQKKPSTLFDLNYEVCSNFIGEICLTYLNFSNFQRAVVGYQRNRFIPENLPFELVSQTLESVVPKAYTRPLAQIFTNHVKSSRTNTLSSLLPLNHASNPQLARHYPFLTYAKENWPFHTARISSASEVWKLWQKMDVTTECAPWSNLDWNPSGISTVDYNSAIHEPSVYVAERYRILQDHEKRTCFALHKAISYAELLDHQALLEKVTLSMMNLGMLINPQLVARLMRPREGALPQSQTIDTHTLLVNGVTRYVARGGKTWPSNTRGVRICRRSCGESHGQWMHTHSVRILEEGGAKWINQRTRCIAQLPLMEFDEVSFIELLNNFRCPDGHIQTISLEDGDLIRGIIIRGGLWFTTFVNWLEACGPASWQCDVIAIAVGYASELKNDQCLTILLDKDCWAKPEHFGELQHFAVQSMADTDNKMSGWRFMFQDETNHYSRRLAEICVPSARLQRSSPLGNEAESTAALIRNASRLSIQARRWSLAIALHTCAYADMVSQSTDDQIQVAGNFSWLYDSSENIENYQESEERIAEFLEAIFSCAKKFGKFGLKACRIQNSAHLCSQHQTVGEMLLDYPSHSGNVNHMGKCLQFALDQTLSRSTDQLLICYTP